MRLRGGKSSNLNEYLLIMQVNSKRVGVVCVEAMSIEHSAVPAASRHSLGVRYRHVQDCTIRGKLSKSKPKWFRFDR